MVDSFVGLTFVVNLSVRGEGWLVGESVVPSANCSARGKIADENRLTSSALVQEY